MNFIDRHFYPLLSLWVLLSLLAAYNSSFRPALRVAIEESRGKPVLADSGFVALYSLSDFPRIQSIDGRQISDLKQLRNAVAVKQIDDEVTLGLENNQTATYKLVRNYPLTFIALNVVIALLFYVIAALVWKLDSRSENKFFPLTGFLFGYAVMCRWTGLYVPFISELVVTLFFFSYPFAYGFLLIFGYQFPSTTHTARARTLTKRAILAVSAFFTLGLMILFFRKSIWPSPASGAAYDEFYRIFRAFGIIAMTGALLLMVYNERRESNPVSRQRLLWIVGGLAFGTFPFFIFWNLPQVFDLPSLLPEWVPIPFLILAPASFAVAIVKYRLFDIELVLSRSLTYGIVLALLILVYVVMTGALSLLVHNTFAFDSGHLSILSTISVALIFSPLRRNIQLQVDRLFFRIRYDRFRSVQNFMQDLEACHDQTRVLKTLDRHFQDSVPVERQRFMRRTAQDWVASNSDVREGELLRNWILERRQSQDVVLNRNHLHRFEDILAWDTAEMPEPWLVCIALGPQTKWFLGPKKSGSRFWQEDLTLAVQMARAAALQQEKLHYIERALQEELERKQAERMNDWKTMLIAEVAHDLRAPLNTLLWKLRTLREKQLSREDSEHHYEDLSRHIYRLQSFVQNLLVLSSMGSQQGYKLQPFQIRDQIDEVFSGIQSLLADKKIKIQVDCDPGITILGEPIVFQEILSNIVQNAAKFSADEGRIRISAQPEMLENKEMVLTMVKDHAGGIPQDVLDSLAVPVFQRTNKKQLQEAFDKQDPKGFNLGLHISQEFTRLMNGRMEIERWSEGTIVKLWFEKPGNS